MHDIRKRTEAGVDTRQRIAVVYTAPDVDSLLASGTEFNAVLPLTPRATEALKQRGIPQLGVEERISTWRLARNIATTRRARRAILKDVEARGGVPVGARFAFLYGYHGVAYGVLRLYDVLGDGPWVVPVGGQWRQIDDIHEAVDVLANQQMLGKGINLVNFPPYRAPPLLPFFRAMRSIMLLLARCRGIAVIGTRAEHPFGLTDELENVKLSPQQFLIAPSTEGWREYLRLVREAWRGLRGGGRIQVRVVSTDGKAADAAADTLRASVESMISDHRLRHAVCALWPRLRAPIRAGAEFSSDIATVIGRIRPSLFLSYEIADGFTAAVAAAAGEHSITRLTVNHNANSPTSSGPAAELTQVLFDTQHDRTLTDVFVFWTPSGAAAARQFLPSSRYSAIYPINRSLRRQRDIPPENKTSERVVLHAGNTMRWFRQFTWIFENSSETVKGLQELARAVSAVPRTRLLVRAKMRYWELDEATIRSQVNPYGEFTLHARAGTSFAADLASASLLVSFSSTTIFDAIHARKPVLLWGGTNRYRRLPARTKLPTASDRAVVYTVETADQLAPMIEAILEAHADCPLTDAEIAPYVWPEGTPDITDLAEAIAAGDYRRAWSSKRP